MLCLLVCIINKIMTTETQQNKEDLTKLQETNKKFDFQFIATIEELKQKGSQLTKWVNDHDILLYEFEGQIKAISNVCRHFGGPVGYHKMNKGTFTCIWHNWKYQAKDGSCMTHPGLPLRQYEIKIVSDKIYVNLLG